MFHPIKRTRKTIAAIKETVEVFQQLIYTAIRTTRNHTEAVAANTVALSALLDTVQNIEAATTATQTATGYLAAAEKHRREQAGLRTDLEVTNA